MIRKQPLRRRIVIAFTLMTLAVSGVFSLGIVGIVHFVEEHLVSQEMSEELTAVLEQDLARGQPPRLDSKTRLYASHMPGYEIPESLRSLEGGFSELVGDDQAAYVYVREIGAQRFILVQEQAEFEARERVLFAVVFAGFLLSVLLGCLLGLLIAQKILAPIIRLAGQVRHRDQLLPLAPPLAPEYPDDEVGHLAEAFDSTLSQLRLSLERERLFTGDVSHELRTPLMIIATSTELLEAAHLGEREQRQVERIARAAEEMRELVGTFLLLARAKGQPVRMTGNASLLSVAQEQVERWQGAFADKGLGFELIVEAEDSGQYHPGLLGTVMSNLLRNALHYTEQGQVRLLLGAGCFRVEDTGPGVPTDQQSDIFEPFVRGNQARGEGLGLGLSLVKRICAHQGWSVSMHSLAAGGSCFDVRLG
ncbi:HAMP domain-containing histidine kinase [Halopseudomonas aestusnigri]|jgi:signal transduction histidine kinase|uniref:sensor histidine kinase n=1 Tax=Halopseudomonas TaxID=2901189 RepID=UPI000C42538E|nr:HAMP domain-containing sensor histidine kinase [Halopseudomonas aestusnigri]MAP76145.1 two-component sensor histidine kinase [Pseudomonadales bacterium]MEE2799905.1 HAMP domain-containing sensor histidine kinase [Pseudomonadota bacterium]HBT56396.1 sensor histidine kinase [Pseudomonas sp.]MAY07670.1 two-component sensor histidine kinase [Pseudomonadales bacterium]UGV30461.1 HAMP domain-containing histidine kinase [Halopseudomonas aestusnigri]|tara:strand:- start:5036 stop:6298 length:1263 start_codon:yes stop_codon:yes gene_type:complete